MYLVCFTSKLIFNYFCEKFGVCLHPQCRSPSTQSVDHLMKRPYELELTGFHLCMFMYCTDTCKNVQIYSVRIQLICGSGNTKDSSCAPKVLSDHSRIYHMYHCYFSFYMFMTIYMQYFSSNMQYNYLNL